MGTPCVVESKCQMPGFSFSEFPDYVNCLATNCENADTELGPWLSDMLPDMLKGMSLDCTKPFEGMLAFFKGCTTTFGDILAVGDSMPDLIKDVSKAQLCPNSCPNSFANN